MINLKLGIVGSSKGNGHPFSFSCIINGYSHKSLANSGWDVIYNYIRQRDPSEFGFENVKVTHAWTQDDDITERLCEACLIPKKVSSLKDLIGSVDAVIIARDDYENHFNMAKLFLENGIPVFVDKPMTVNVEELKYFKDYLESGQLMSCSGFRYAKELDEIRAKIFEYGKIKLIRGTVINNWEQYGIHILEAVLSTVDLQPISILPLYAEHTSFMIKLGHSGIFQIDSLGNVPKTFLIDIWGSKNRSSHEISDNFSAFRRMLWHFINSIRSHKPAIPPHETIDLIKLLIAGKIARSENREVFLNEIIL